jgi:hypothetical protein
VASLIEHLIRHARRWADLPLTSVPSAAVTDDDTAEWSRDSYSRDLDGEKIDPADEQPIVVGMRPRTLRRRLALAFFGAILAGCVLGTGIARADVNVCAALDESPTIRTVEQLVTAYVIDGWSTHESGTIIARTVLGICPEHVVVLECFVASYSNGWPVVAR